VRNVRRVTAAFACMVSRKLKLRHCGLPKRDLFREID
jgi:hypothetical protein